MTNHNDIEPRIAQLESRVDSVAEKSDIEDLEDLRSNISSNLYLRRQTMNRHILMVFDHYVNFCYYQWLHWAY